jgi:hypothetical protein
LTVIEARTVLAARALLQYFKLNYDATLAPKDKKRGGKKERK